MWGRVELGMMYGLLGQYERGLAQIDEAVSAAVARQQMPWPLTAYRSQLYLAAGNVDRAEAMIAPGVAEPPTHLMLGVFATWGWNKVLLAKREYALAVQSAQEFLPVLRGFNCRLFVPDTLLALGEAHLGLGQMEPARARLAEAQREAEAMGLDWILWQILAARARLETQAGQAAAGISYLGQAQDVVQRIAGGLSDAGLRASFLDRPEVRAVG
jgi:tetratricopeptide (TPR) repeat protein